MLYVYCKYSRKFVRRVEPVGDLCTEAAAYVFAEPYYVVFGVIDGGKK